MKCKFFILMCLVGLSFLIFFISCENGASSSDTVSKLRPVVKKAPEPVKGSPSAFIPENSYEFPPTVEGVKITHDYIIENRGDRNLEISRVKTGWGCTAAFFTRLIPPGGEGTISIKLNTSGRGGGELKKYISVYTNDPDNPRPKLIIFGEVMPFADIHPPSASLRGLAGESIKKNVWVTPREDYPFTIVSSKAQFGKNIKFKIEKEEKWRGVRYLVAIENIKEDTGGYGDTIILKTDSNIKPEIRIPVFGRILVKQ